MPRPFACPGDRNSCTATPPRRHCIAPRTRAPCLPRPDGPHCAAGRRSLDRPGPPAPRPATGMAGCAPGAGCSCPYGSPELAVIWLLPGCSWLLFRCYRRKEFCVPPRPRTASVASPAESHFRYFFGAGAGRIFGAGAAGWRCLLFPVFVQFPLLLFWRISVGFSCYRAKKQIACFRACFRTCSCTPAMSHSAIFFGAISVAFSRRATPANSSPGRR